MQVAFAWQPMWETAMLNYHLVRDFFGFCVAVCVERGAMSGSDQTKFGQGGHGAGMVAKAAAAVTQTAKDAYNSVAGTLAVDM